MRSSSHDDLEIRDEVTIHDILMPVWRYRRLTLWLMALGFILVILYQFFGTPLYTAQITIAPLPSDLTLSQQGSGIAGLSLLSSVSGSSSGPTDFDTFTTLLQSPEIAHNLERDYHVSQYIFANSWDPLKKKWTPDREFFLVKILRLLVNKPWHPPSDQDLANYLTQKINVTTLGPFTVLSFDFKDPKIALAVMGGLVAEAQKVIRNQQHLRANVAIKFLNKQLETSPSSMAQQALIALAIEWEQKKLLAENDLDVGVEISQPLTVSNVPTSPALLIDMLIGIGGLALLGVTISGILGLFVTDDPRILRSMFVRRFGSWPQRLKGLFGGLRFRYQR